MIQADSIPGASELDCDLCIVGAGAAGITIAHSLRDSGIKIILLDSGYEDLDARAQDLASGRNIGLDYWPLDSVRLRMFGGSTNHWEGSCNDFDEIDFVDRPWVRHGGWPLSKAQLVPYYKRAVNYVQLGPYDFSLQSWSKRLNIDVPGWIGGELVGNVTQHSPPTRFGEVYGPDLKAAANIRIVLGATALRFEMNSTRALGERLEVARFDKQPFFVRARRFVLAMGGIENARFLLVNNIGNGSGAVGRYFMEHPYFRPMLLAPSPSFLRFVRLWQKSFDRGVRVSPSIQFAQAVLWHRQFQNCRIAFEPTDRFTASAGIESFHEISSGDVKSTDELLYHIGNLLLDVDMVSEAASRQEFGHGFLPISSEFSGFTIGCMTEQLPNPDSRVLLSSSMDRFGQPRVAVDLRLSDEDRLGAGRFAKEMSETFARVGIGRVRVLVPERFEHWPPRIISYGSHHMGTTRMSHDPKTGVVDVNLKLHQSGNIFVAGSSVFPTGSHVPPTLTIVALALRLSDYLRSTPP